MADDADLDKFLSQVDAISKMPFCQVPLYSLEDTGDIKSRCNGVINRGDG